MRTAPWTLVHKELRALLPWWAAIAGVIVLCSIVVRMDMAAIISADAFVATAFFTYAIGAVLLGAISFGHDYQHQTMAMLLMQPISRTGMFAAKVLVLVPLLLLLLAVTTASLNLSPAGAVLSSLPQAWFPLAAGLALAPGLALITSGPLAATVFAIALLTGVVPVSAYFDVPVASLWPGIVLLTILGPFMTWRAFGRLEVTGGTRMDVGLVPMAIRRTAAVRTPRTAHPLKLLIVKELWLQQLAFVAAGLYLLVWIGTWMTDRVTDSYIPNELSYAATQLFGIIVSLLAGALASAEERRLGTAGWHALLPIQARLQWIVKAGVALTLAMTLASVVPGLLTVLAPNPVFSETFHPGLAASLCVIGLYTSSLSRSGIHATLATVPAVAVAAAIGALVILPVLRQTAPLVQQVAAWVYPLLDITQPDWRWHRYLINAGWIVFLVLLAAFAGANHRTADRSRTRILRQCGWLAALALTTLLLSSLVQAIMLEWRRLSLLSS